MDQARAAAQARGGQVHEPSPAVAPPRASAPGRRSRTHRRVARPHLRGATACERPWQAGAHAQAPGARPLGARRGVHHRARSRAQATYTVTVAGAHSVFVMAGGHQVAGSPFVARAAPGAVAAPACRLFGPGLAAVALGRDSRLFLELADAFGNAVAPPARPEAAGIQARPRAALRRRCPPPDALTEQPCLYRPAAGAGRPAAPGHQAAPSPATEHAAQAASLGLANSVLRGSSCRPSSTSPAWLQVVQPALLASATDS
jgi:hypothetical protein